MPEKTDAFIRQVTRALARLRKGANITTEELAERLQIAPQNVRRIEAGQNLTLATLQRVARALGFDVEITFKPRKRRTGG